MIYLITVGTTEIYVDTGLNSVYDASLNSALDALTNEQMAAIASQVLNEGSLLIDHYTDGRATCAFTIWDSAGAYTFYERQQVTVEDLDGVVWFGGVVQSVESVHIPGSTKKFHSVSAADYTAILDWRIVDYAAEDTLAGTAVKAIMAEYLAAEGITEGEIEDGELLTQIAIGNKSAFEGLMKLAEACNFVCYLDYDLKLYFHARTLYAASWSVTDGTDIRNDTFQVTRSNDNYRNAEVIIGGYEETSLQSESWVGDGTTKTFPLAYGANRFVTVTVDGAAKTIGVKGTDAGEYDCYYAIKSETLTFDTAPANAKVVAATYYGLWQAKSKAEDLTAQGLNATRQGFGTGIIEHLTSDETLNSIVAAGEYAEAKLGQYAVDGIQVSYKTRREGLAAGTLQHIHWLGLEDDFLITHVGVEAKDGDVEYNVEAVHGPVQDAWDLFFLETFDAATAISLGVEESGVTKLYNFSHEYEAVDRPNPFTSAVPGALVSADTWPVFEPTDRAEYIEFWHASACVYRAQHTSVPDELDNVNFYSYSFIGPAAYIGDIDEVVFWSGDAAAIAYGSGVEIYRAAFVRTKTALESYQVNMNYINGA